MGKSREELELEFKVNKIRSDSQSDWGVNDDGSPLFIKNRVCSEDVILDSDTLPVISFYSELDELDMPLHYTSKVLTKDDLIGLHVVLSSGDYKLETTFTESDIDSNYDIIDGHLSLGNPEVWVCFPFMYTQWHLDNISRLSDTMVAICSMLESKNFPFGTYMFAETVLDDVTVSFHFSKSVIQKIDSKFLPTSLSYQEQNTSANLRLVPDSFVFSTAINSESYFTFSFDVPSEDGVCYKFSGNFIITSEVSSIYYVDSEGSRLYVLPNITTPLSPGMYHIDAYIYKGSEDFGNGTVIFTSLRFGM